MREGVSNIISFVEEGLQGNLGSLRYVNNTFGAIALIRLYLIGIALFAVFIYFSVNLTEDGAIEHDTIFVFAYPTEQSG